METDEVIGQDAPVAVAWTPLWAAAWIKSGGVEPAFSDESRNLRWAWKDTTGENEFRHAFDFHANELSGWVSQPDPANDDSDDSKAIPEIPLLKANLITGAVGASGLPKEAGPRVAIPRFILLGRGSRHGLVTQGGRIYDRASPSR